ncbi:MAG: class I SAM-dependent methyltransferase [Myxococcota bacterium]
MNARVLLVACIALQLSGCGAWKRFAYEGFGRDSWQRPDEVIALLGLAEGDTVADLGAGGGYFTFRLAAAVGDGGRVYAVDVDDDMLAYLRERVADDEIANVEVVRGEFHDPMLPDGEIDLLFTSNTYHHIEDRSSYFAGVLTDLVPNGRVAILELKDHSWFPRTFGHWTPKQDIVDEMTAAGYELVGDHDVVERQHFLVFRPKD